MKIKAIPPSNLTHPTPTTNDSNRGPDTESAAHIRRNNFIPGHSLISTGTSHICKQSISTIQKIKERLATKNEVIKIELPLIRERAGHICKPTSLANIDHYWANRYNVKNIPVRKNHKGIYENDLNSRHKQSNPNQSVRQIAKQNNSKQGEVLQLSDFKQIAKEMGYKVDVYHPRDVEALADLISTNLKRKIPLITFFEVETGGVTTGRPTSYNIGREHACVIVGINRKDHCVNIAHWGSQYNDAPLSNLHASMNCLVDTRDVEKYKKDPSFSRNNLKYDLVDPSDNSDGLLKSISPESSSGFKNCLIVPTPDTKHQRWHSRFDLRLFNKST